MKSAIQSGEKMENSYTVNLSIVRRLALVPQDIRAMHLVNFLNLFYDSNDIENHEKLLSSCEYMGLIYITKELASKKTIVILNRNKISQILRNPSKYNLNEK